jgi:hypothetical protein
VCADSTAGDSLASTGGGDQEGGKPVDNDGFVKVGKGEVRPHNLRGVCLKTARRGRLVGEDCVGGKGELGSLPFPSSVVMGSHKGVHTNSMATVVAGGTCTDA